MRGLRVGIAWQGSPANLGDKFRSVPLMQFAPLAAVHGVKLFSLQKNEGAEQLAQPGARGSGLLTSASEPKAIWQMWRRLMMSLDLIVTVDTALAHVAGALQRPVWVAIPFPPDWRWRREGETTAWYPSMRLFRQMTRGDWTGVFGRMATALARSVTDAARGRDVSRGVE